MTISKKIPGSCCLPYIGETFKIFSGQEKFYYDQFLLYGEISKTRIMGMDFTLLLSPELNKFVLKDQAYKFSSKLGWKYLEPFLGDGLLLQDGEHHARIRKILYPSFHSSSINVLFSNIVKSFDISINKWKCDASIPIYSEVYTMIFKIACHIMFGDLTANEIDLIEEDIILFFDGMKAVLRVDFPFTKFGIAQSAKRKLHSRIVKNIEIRRSNKSDVCHNDVLGLMLEAKNEHGCSLTDREIENQILQLLFGGRETLAFSLTWLIYEMYVNPTWLNLLRDEVALSNISLDISNISNQKFPLIDLAIKEIERLYPPVYFIPRGVLEDFRYERYHISAGEHIMLSPFVTNRLPHIFKDPHSFDPLRFSPDRDESKGNPFAAIPYGAGSHRCLGRDLARLEMKIFLLMFLQKFDFEVFPILESGKPIMHPRKWHKQFRMKLSLL